jgi:hypothetical protein
MRPQRRKRPTSKTVYLLHTLGTSGTTSRLPAKVRSRHRGHVFRVYVVRAASMSLEAMLMASIYRIAGGL